MPKKRKTLLLTAADIKHLITMREAIRSLETAFRSFALGKSTMPPKTYLDLPQYKGDFRAMPAYDDVHKLCSLKWVNVHPHNKKYGLPTVMGMILLSDPKTAYPLCIMDGTLITYVRTGAAGGVAAKYLAPPKSKTVGLIGCGHQAITQLNAVLTLHTIKNFRLWDLNPKAAERFSRYYPQFKNQMIITKTPGECARACDIILTTTPARKALINIHDLKTHVHINAIGADAPGKQELDSHILKKSKLVVDSWEQACHSGEINVAVHKKQIQKKDIHAELGQILCGKKSARTSRDRITVFDSTGLAIQDASIASLIYKKALKKGVGQWFDFLDI